MARRRSRSSVRGLPRTPRGLGGLPPAARVAVTLIVVIAGLVGTYLKSQQAKQPPSDSSGTAATVAGTVTRVADGDTLDVDTDGSGPLPPVKVRLLGIDTPELHPQAAPGRQLPPDVEQAIAKLGQAARDYTRSKCDGQAVTLAYDGEKAKTDKYGRTLAYVVLPDGTMLNESLVRDGYAFAHRTLTCGRTATLIRAEDDARQARRGLWTSMRLELMPEWRQRWVSEGSPASR